MLQLERIWDDRNRKPVLLMSSAITAIIAVVDWRTNAYVSLGFLYLFPIIFIAGFVPRWAVVLLAAGCAVLAEVFSSLAPSFVRLAFVPLGLSGSGVFFADLIPNRRLTLEGQTRLLALGETAPAAI